MEDTDRTRVTARIKETSRATSEVTLRAISRATSGGTFKATPRVTSRIILRVDEEDTEETTRVAVTTTEADMADSSVASVAEGGDCEDERGREDDGKGRGDRHGG
jgi:hypothetical protein